MFRNSTSGVLVPIDGVDPRHGTWSHHAFLPNPLPEMPPSLSSATHLQVANARAALAALDNTARRLPNPRLLRRPALRREAQSTSALEGTYEPLRAVLTADEEETSNVTMREVLNFVRMADLAFAWVDEGRRITPSLLSQLQGTLLAGTANQAPSSGNFRDHQVVVGHRDGVAPNSHAVQAARYVPPPPGPDLAARVGDLLDWIATDRSDTLDPVVGAAMAHYQFEALHPYHDGNGRLGRLLIVVQLQLSGALSEPTLTVSPWFEERRSDYYDLLLAVSASSDWDAWVGFFARGLAESAKATHDQLLRLIMVADVLKSVLRASKLRADSAHVLVDFAVSNTTFSVRDVQRELGVSYGRANGLVRDLVDLHILAGGDDSYNRTFFAPAVLKVLLE